VIPADAVNWSDVDPQTMTREDRRLQRVGQARTPDQLAAAFARGRREPGDKVTFPSPSAPSGRRVGTIVACGPKRALVAFTFYNGRESTRAIPYTDL